MSILSPFPLTHDKDVTPDRVSRKPRVSALLQIPCGCEDGWVWQPRRERQRSRCMDGQM